LQSTRSNASLAAFRTKSGGLKSLHICCLSDSNSWDRARLLGNDVQGSLAHIHDGLNRRLINSCTDDGPSVCNNYYLSHNRTASTRILPGDFAYHTSCRFEDILYDGVNIVSDMVADLVVVIVLSFVEFLRWTACQKRPRCRPICSGAPTNTVTLKPHEEHPSAGEGTSSQCVTLGPESAEPREPI
jgi:hypothetical protein